MVREAEHPPICRHGDPQTVAEWMVRLPKHHPLFKAKA